MSDFVVSRIRSTRTTCAGKYDVVKSIFQARSGVGDGAGGEVDLPVFDAFHQCGERIRPSDLESRVPRLREIVEYVVLDAGELAVLPVENKI